MNDDIQQHLLKSSIFRIGLVSSVDGRTVTIRVDRDKNLSHLLYKGELLNNVSVGSYVKILKGFNCLVGKIEREYIKELSLQGDYTAPNGMVARFLIVQLIGYFQKEEHREEVKEQIKYRKGVKELPLIGNECLILEQNEYQKIHNFTSDNEVSIRLGHLITDESISIDISVNKLFASHIGIFGNTGSGKSHTLATLYKNLFVKFDNENKFQNNAKFLLFDFNGEYSNNTSITSQKKVYNLSTHTEEGGNKIPLSPKDILSPELFFILASATEKTQQPFIKRAIRRYQKYCHQEPQEESKNELYKVKEQLQSLLARILSTGNRMLSDTALAYLESILSHKTDLRSGLGWHGQQNCFYIENGKNRLYFNSAKPSELCKFTKFHNAIEHLEKDSNFISWITKYLYIQLIDDILSNRAQSEHIAPAISKLKSLSRDFFKIFSIPTEANSEEMSIWEREKPLVVINLDKVSTSMKKLVPLLLSHKCYQEHKNEKSEVVTKSLNIIIDEAHNILSYESSRESETWKDFRLETFEEIIKEGRKFGVFLTIASQRPSDISPTIISQLHNYLIHRLINNRDIEMVEKAISYLDKISIETLPILPAGACVLSGIIADLPLILQVDRLSEEEQPKSQTIPLSKYWSDTAP